MQFGFTDPWWQSLVDRLPQVSVTVLQPHDWTDYLQLATTVVVTIATVYVAKFASAEIRVAREARESRERVAAKRVSAIAFAVRRTIDSWLDEAPRTEQRPGYVAPDTRVGWEEHIEAHYGAAEVRFESLMREAAEGSAAITRPIVAAYVKFYQAASVVNQLLRIQRMKNLQAVPLDVRKVIKTLLEACSEHLTSVIDAEMKDAEREVASMEWSFPWGSRRRRPPSESDTSGRPSARS